jgi:hypothetical protein
MGSGFGEAGALGLGALGALGEATNCSQADCEPFLQAQSSELAQPGPGPGPTA